MNISSRNHLQPSRHTKVLSIPLQRYSLPHIGTVLVLVLLATWAGTTSAAEEKMFSLFKVDQLEYRAVDGNDVVTWDAGGWVGSDYHKLAFKTEGEKVRNGHLEQAEFQLLYSRLVSKFWDLQLGVRYDFQPHPQRAYGVIGFQGLAPQWFEVDSSLFVSEEGDISVRFDAEYDILLTQKLILQPSAEVNVAAQKVAELGIGSGINDLELGLRLRYEVAREFSPYIGINWERKIGSTANLARDEGEDINVFSVLGGFSFWF